MNDGLKFFLVLTGTLLLIAFLVIVVSVVMVTEKMSVPSRPSSNSVEISQ